MSRSTNKIKPKDIKGRVLILNQSIDFKLFNFLFDLCKDRRELWLQHDITEMKKKVTNLTNDILASTEVTASPEKTKTKKVVSDVTQLDEQKLSRISEAVSALKQLHDIITEHELLS